MTMKTSWHWSLRSASRTPRRRSVFHAYACSASKTARKVDEGIRGYIDPWVSAGVTYVHDGQTFSRPAATASGSTVNAEWQLDTHSIGVPLGIGVDYRVTKAISVGPSFEYVILNPLAGCAKLSAAGFQGNRLCTDSAGGALVAEASGAWNLGLSIRLTPL